MGGGRAITRTAVGLRHLVRFLVEVDDLHSACSPKSATTSDSKHQSASDQRGRKVDHITQHVLGGEELVISEIRVKDHVEVIVPLAKSVTSSRLLSAS